MDGFSEFAFKNLDFWMFRELSEVTLAKHSYNIFLLGGISSDSAYDLVVT